MTDKTARALDRGLLVVVAFFAVLAVLQAFYILGTDSYGREPRRLLFYSIPGWIALGLWLRGSQAGKRRFFLVLYLLAVCEVILQGAAALGAIPRVHTYKHVPYGRVYYTKEGFAKDRMNRFGWHAREFRLDPALRKLALIGDSFILSIGVPAEENAGALLEDLLTSGPSASGSVRRAPEAVIPLGRSNIGPPQYLELLRYAQRKFQPEEAIITIFLGNDLRSLLVPDEARRRARSIYYRLGEDHRPELLPESEGARNRFVRKLEYNHRSVVWLLPLILTSHYLTPPVLLEFYDALRDGLKRLANPTARVTKEEQDLAAELHWLGVDGFAFRKPLSRRAEDALAVGLALLEEAHRHAQEHGIHLRLVTIPAIPPSFYTRYQGSDWSFQLDEYDLELLERRIVAFAEERGIPILPIARTLKERNMTVEEIGQLYFNGYGHLSSVGQQFLAWEIWSRFYAPQTD